MCVRDQKKKRRESEKFEGLPPKEEKKSQGICGKKEPLAIGIKGHLKFFPLQVNLQDTQIFTK
jgi:hypothetical protein